MPTDVRDDLDRPTPPTMSRPQPDARFATPAPAVGRADAVPPVSTVSVRRTALHIAGVYFAVGLLWILLSDRGLEWMIGTAPPQRPGWAQTYKGWFFVAATSALLYVLCVRGLRQVRAGQRAAADGARLFRGVVDSNVVGICFWHADGRVREANAAYLDLVGYDEADVRAGRVHWRDMTPARFEPLDRAAVDAALARGVSEPYEKEYVRKDGRHVPVLVRVAALPGERDLGVAAVIDISQRKHAEEQARRLNAELEDAARLKDQFLAVLSHELRTPITAIRLWTQLLRAAESDPAVSAEALAMIEQGVEAQTQLINDLLDVSRIVSGHLRLEARPADLCPLIASAAAALEPVAHEGGLSLDVELGPGPLTVVGDAGRLRQVAWNLLSNAIKFTPAGGRVHLSLGAGVNGSDCRGPAAVLVVRDTGIGIDATFMPQLFELFRQADSSTTRRHGGLGIGLSIVKRLVELQGGTIRAQSAGRGLGCTFTVELPLCGGVEATSSAGPAAPAIDAAVAAAMPLPQGADGRAAAVASIMAPAPSAPDKVDAATAIVAPAVNAAAVASASGTSAPPTAPVRAGAADPGPPAPLNPAAPNPAPRSVEEPGVLSGVRVMVVDDHEDTCRAVARLLRSHGGTVLTAHAVEPALRLLDGTTPDVLVSDIGLPDADGHDLIRAVRARETAGRRNGAERHLRAIALTAYAMPEDRERALSAGFDDYLSKPIDFNVLLEKVRSLAPVASAATPDQ